MITARDAARVGRSDADQLAYAVAEDRAIVTNNREDFRELAEQYRCAGRHHHGIVVAVRRPARETARKLLAVVNRLTADELDDLFLYL